MPFRLYDYLPILLMFIVAGGFAVGNVLLSQFVGQRKRTQNEVDALRVRQGSGGLRARTVFGEVLPDRDDLHPVRYRSDLPRAVGGGVQIARGAGRSDATRLFTSR